MNTHAREPRQAFLELVLANPVNAELLRRLVALQLPDWYLVAGCLFQSVWNGLTGRPATHGIADYDVFYFDEADLGWDAEDAVIRRCSAAFADIDADVQVRNQARVHLWYPAKYGVACAPLRNSREGIDTFLNQSSCFGVRANAAGAHGLLTAPGEHGTFDAHGALDVYAPFGFEDLFAMVIRPNPRRAIPRVYYEKADRWRQLWPELTVLPWPEEETLPHRVKA